MNRRAFVTALAAVLVAPLGADAQQQTTSAAVAAKNYTTLFGWIPTWLFPFVVLAAMMLVVAAILLAMSLLATTSRAAPGGAAMKCDFCHQPTQPSTSAYNDALRMRVCFDCIRLFPERMVEYRDRAPALKVSYVIVASWLMTPTGPMTTWTSGTIAFVIMIWCPLLGAVIWSRDRGTVWARPLLLCQPIDQSLACSGYPQAMDTLVSAVILNAVLPFWSLTQKCQSRRPHDSAVAAAAGGSGDRSMRTASGSRHTYIAPSEAVTVHQPSIRAREAAHDVVFDRRRSPDRRGGASQPIVRSLWTINHPENARTGTVAVGSRALGTAGPSPTRDWRQRPGAAPDPERGIRRSRSGHAASRRDGRASAGQGRPWPWADRVAEGRRSNCV